MLGPCHLQRAATVSVKRISAYMFEIQLTVKRTLATHSSKKQITGPNFGERVA